MSFHIHTIICGFPKLVYLNRTLRLCEPLRENNLYGLSKTRIAGVLLAKPMSIRSRIHPRVPFFLSIHSSGEIY
jgi:hypothetical protein